MILLLLLYSLLLLYTLQSSKEIDTHTHTHTHTHEMKIYKTYFSCIFMLLIRTIRIEGYTYLRAYIYPEYLA